MAAKKAPKKYPEDHCNPLNVDLNAPPINPAIDKIVNDLANPQNRKRIPGLAVVVRQDNKIVHLNCYGYANLETDAKVRLDTIFDLGSLSKQFTAVAVLQLVINNKLSLQDPLSKFFKGFPRYADAITVEDLIHHTSGLPDYSAIYVQSRRAEEDWYDKIMATENDWYPQMAIGRKEITNKDVLKWIATQTLLPRPPKTEYEYCNSGYVVLAEIVARVAKKRLGEYLKEYLFEGLGMHDTYVFDETSRFSPDAREVVNHARCYNRVSGGNFVPVGYTPLNFITGDGNFHSTIVDLAKWERNLHELEFNPVADLLWKPGKVRSRKKQNYGAGWKLLRDKHETEVEVDGKPVMMKYERRADYHRGTWLGWRNFIARGSRWPVPKPGKKVNPKTVESLGIVVLSNSRFGHEQFTTCRIAQEISKLYWKRNNIMRQLNCGV
jgi:CubicO group peptidase (beta-lactamase class C family)